MHLDHHRHIARVILDNKDKIDLLDFLVGRLHCPIFLQLPKILEKPDYNTNKIFLRKKTNKQKTHFRFSHSILVYYYNSIYMINPTRKMLKSWPSIV